jgi:hypothetical protein
MKNGKILAILLVLSLDTMLNILEVCQAPLSRLNVLEEDLLHVSLGVDALGHNPKFQVCGVLHHQSHILGKDHIANLPYVHGYLVILQPGDCFFPCHRMSPHLGAA